MSQIAQYTLIIPPAAASERLDKALTMLLSERAPELSRARVQALIELGHVSLDQPSGITSVRDAAMKVRPGQMFTVVIPPLASSKVEAQAIELDIVYEDAHVLV